MSEEQIEPTLPSEQVEQPTFDEYVATNTSENGKLFGRFDNAESALDYFRNQEVTHTNNMRALKEEQKTNATTQQTEEVAKQEEAQRVQKVNEMIPSFIENGMKMSDEMSTLIQESGMSAAEVELGAYKVRELQKTAYDVYGGEEKFHAVKAWANDNLDEATKGSFDVSMQGMMKGNTQVGVLAMEGLLARYNSANGQPSQRVTGSTPHTPTTGYSSQADMFKDKREADKNPALRDAYQRKMALTKDSIIFGR